VLRHIVGKLAAGQGLLLQASIHARSVERKRVCRGKHAYVRQNGRIVFRVAIAVGGNVHYKRDVEARSAVYHGFCVLCHTAVEHGICVIVLEAYGVEVASAEASAAAHAISRVYRHLFLFGIENKPAVCTLTQAEAATAAFCFFNKGFSAAVLFRFACAGAATHADILYSAAEACHLVALEVCKAYEYVGIHNSPAYFRVFYVFAACNGNFYIVRTLKTVAYDDGATDGKGSKTVFPSAFEVLQRIFSAAGVHGVAVCEEWLAAKLLYNVDNCARVVGSQVAYIAKLAEMELDGNELAFQVEVGYPCCFHKSFKLCGQALAELCAKISKIYFCFFHNYSPFKMFYASASAAVISLLVILPYKAKYYNIKKENSRKKAFSAEKAFSVRFNRGA
jgi:hypothetical protein